MKTPSVIVVGAGIGGIVTAAHLARMGMRVTVIEKNRWPGGRCDRIARDGHTFDTGPTLLVMPLVYEKEFAALGVSFRELFDLCSVDPTYHLIFESGKQLALSSDMRFMWEQLEAIEKGSFQGFLRYMQEGERYYNLAMKNLVDKDFRSPFEFFTLSNLLLFYRIKALVPHYRHMSAYFKEPYLKAAFTFQDVYMGLSPFEAASTFALMPYSELAHGVWYPRGGMYSIVEGLMDVARQSGVEFLFHAEAERIEVKNGRVRGVTLVGGNFLAADAVVANADLPYVYQELLPGEAYAKRLARKEFSCSVISFFWGVDKAYPLLGPHTLFLADDYRGNFESMARHVPLAENPSLYVHAPVRLDPSAAPVGEDSLIAIVPVDHLDGSSEQDWQAIREEARQIVFKRLAEFGITDLQEHIKFEVNYTPLSWCKRYNLMKGATHGLSHTIMQLGYLRPRNRHARYHNLYFVGASTHPGTGVPTALIGARHVANRVKADWQRKAW